MRSLAALFGWPLRDAMSPVAATESAVAMNPLLSESPHVSHRVDSPEAAPLLRRRPEWHAEQFLAWLRSTDWGAAERETGVAKLTVTDVQRAYIEWCADELIEPRPWSPIAAHFNRLARIRGRPRKPFGWEVDELTGDRRRVRVYLIELNVSTCVHDDQPAQALAA